MFAVKNSTKRVTASSPAVTMRAGMASPATRASSTRSEGKNSPLMTPRPPRISARTRPGCRLFDHVEVETGRGRELGEDGAAAAARVRPVGGAGLAVEEGAGAVAGAGLDE